MTEGAAFRRAVDAVLPASSSKQSRLHGESHWRRVAINGVAVAAETPGADALVAALFGVFHDSMRMNDGIDPRHGRRGGELARRVNGAVGLDQSRLDLLVAACDRHTHGETTSDPTIGACWDADRLDLVRLGFAIDRKRISTEAARTPESVARAVALLSAPLTWDDVERRLFEVLDGSDG